MRTSRTPALFACQQAVHTFIQARHHGSSIGKTECVALTVS
jgi:hypothetical protein